MKPALSQTALQRLARSSRYHPNTRCVSGRLFHNKSNDSSEALGVRAKLPDAENVPLTKPRAGITIHDILERRAKAGKLVAGTAAASDSDMFKGPVCNGSLGPFS